MKVKELIKALKVFNQELEIFLASDSEGNTYGTIEPDSVYRHVEKINNKHKHVVVIYPVEYLDYDELFGEQEPKDKFEDAMQISDNDYDMYI